MGLSINGFRALLDECPSVSCSEATLGNTFPFIIRCGTDAFTMMGTVDKNLVQFRTIHMLSAPDRSVRPTLLRAMLEMNYQYKMAKFTLDESDDEVVVYIDLYVGPGTLTKKQVQRCVGVFQSVVVAGKNRCEKIIATGKDPGPTESTGGLPRQMMAAALREALLARAAATSQPTEEKKPAPQDGKRKGGFAGILDDLSSDDDGN